ncbi:hypothetical protein AAG154_001581 [Listeria innocua]
MKSKTYVATITYRDDGVYQSFTLEVAAKNKLILYTGVMLLRTKTNV